MKNCCQIGSVEAELLADALDLRRSRVVARDERRRVAGSKPQQKKDEDRDERP